MEGEVTTTESAEPAQQPAVSSNGRTADFDSANSGSSPETATTQAEQTQEQKPTGFDPVEFTPEQKARVDRIYGNMKRYETAAKKVPELEQANQVLAEQLRILNETQGKVINHLQISDFQDAEQQLKTQRQKAWTDGNSALYDEANDKLRDLSVRRAMTEMQTQQRPQQIPQPQMRAVNGEAVIDLAVKQGAVTNEEATAYRAWMAESDETGSPKRPWISEHDPRNMAAASEGRAVFNNPAYANMSFAQKLQEIDRRMGVRMQQGQNVLPNGNLTAPRKNSNVKLTDYEAKIAIKTKFGGPKAKSEADHTEAYRQAKIRSQQKGARQ